MMYVTQFSSPYKVLRRLAATVNLVDLTLAVQYYIQSGNVYLTTRIPSVPRTLMTLVSPLEKKFLSNTLFV